MSIRCLWRRRWGLWTTAKSSECTGTHMGGVRAPHLSLLRWRPGGLRICLCGMSSPVLHLDAAVLAFGAHPLERLLH